MNRSINLPACIAIAAVAILGVLLSSCDSGGLARVKPAYTQSYVDYAGAPIKEFHSWRLDGWEAVSRNKLVVWGGVNEAYLLTVWDSCQDLLFANRVAVSSTLHSFSTLETVSVGRERCPISEIRPIDIKRMKADRAAARAGHANQPAKPIQVLPDKVVHS